MALPQTAELTIGSGQWWTSPNARSAVTATAISDGTTIKRDALSEGPALVPSFVTFRPSPVSLADLSARPEQKGSDPLTDTPEGSGYSRFRWRRIAATRINTRSFIRDRSGVAPTPGGVTCPDCALCTAPE